MKSTIKGALIGLAIGALAVPLYLFVAFNYSIEETRVMMLLASIPLAIVAMVAAHDRPRETLLAFIASAAGGGIAIAVLQSASPPVKETVTDLMPHVAIVAMGLVVGTLVGRRKRHR